MYNPPAFVVADIPRLHDLITAYPLAVCVSQGESGLTGNHIPWIIDRSTGPLGCLLGHVARANPLWKTAAGREMLCVFSGPQAYISPTWYEAEQTVPTWNYVAVQAAGTVELVESGPALMAILQMQVQQFERDQAVPWKMDSESSFLQKLATQVVGLRIPLARLDGKWKLSQNHSHARRSKVIQQLAAQSDAQAQQMAAWMQRELEAT